MRFLYKFNTLAHKHGNVEPQGKQNVIQVVVRMYSFMATCKLKPVNTISFFVLEFLRMLRVLKPFRKVTVHYIRSLWKILENVKYHCSTNFLSNMCLFVLF